MGGLVMNAWHGLASELVAKFSLVAYPSPSRDLARFRDDDRDEEVSRLIDTISGSDQRTWGEVRSSLDARGIACLLAFSHRAAALAIRKRSSRIAALSLSAHALISSAKVSDDDRNVEFSMLAIREAGAPLEDTLSVAVARADTAARKLMASRARRMDKLSLRECGFLAVTSKHGLGFMGTWGQPPPSDSRLPLYGINVADVLEEESEYQVESVHLGPLPEVWFDFPNAAGRNVETRGCVNLAAARQGFDRYEHGLLCFLADLGDPARAMRLTERARGLGPPRHAIAVGRILLTVIGHPGTLESQEAIERLAVGLARTLPSAS